MERSVKSRYYALGVQLMSEFALNHPGLIILASSEMPQDIADCLEEFIEDDLIELLRTSSFGRGVLSGMIKVADKVKRISTGNDDEEVEAKKPLLN